MAIAGLVAFVSPAGGVWQVFLMLTSGGEPLQLTNDEGDKLVDAFSPDGTNGLTNIWKYGLLTT